MLAIVSFDTEGIIKFLHDDFLCTVYSYENCEIHNSCSAQRNVMQSPVIIMAANTIDCGLFIPPSLH